jgi:hypothetical protein
MIPRVLALAALAGATALHSGPARPAPTTGSGTCSAGICLDVTLGTDTSEGACGTVTSLDVTAGDPVNLCYTVTNGSSDTLNYQWLGDDVDGAFLTAAQQTLAPGASYQYNRVFAAYRSETPTATWQATAAQTTYAHDDSGASGFVDIASTGDLVGYPQQNSWIAMTSLPFAFRFYDQTSDQLCVSANGLLFFGVDTCPIEPFAPLGVYWFENVPLPALPAPAIAPYWMHFYFDGQVHTQTLGTAPNRQFIVEWSNEQAWNSSGDGGTGNPIVAFEAIFDEASGNLSFEYEHTAFGDPASDDGAAATVGLQRDGDYADQYSYDTASLHDGQSIVWTPSHPVGYSASAQVQLAVGAPTLALTPTALDGAASTGSSTTLPLSIANGGDRDLDWTLQKAAVPADAHFPRHTREFAHGVRDGKTAERAPSAAPWSRALFPQRPLGDAVPAYAIAALPDGVAFVAFDATQPGSLETVLDGEESDITAATFIGNDFSQEYAVKVTQSGPLHFYTSKFGTLDTATGQFTPIATITLPSITYVGALKWDPVSGMLYAITVTSTGSGVQSYGLYTIDAATGDSAFVGSIQGSGVNPNMLIINAAISPNGLLYAIDIVDNVLLAIDKSTGNAAVIGPTGLVANFAQGMDFDQSTGLLYWAAYTLIDDAGDYGSSLYTLDVDSGHPTLVGDVQDSAELAALAIAHADPCLDAGDVPWLAFDSTAGTTVGGSTSTVTLTLDAAGLAPGTYQANVCVYTNDANHSIAAVPVSFTVTSDVIFEDGFDGP